MPIPLPAAPWLQPPDVAGSYLKGVEIGNRARAEAAQIGVAQQRIAQQAASDQAQLAQHAQTVQMEIAAKQQEQERQNLMDQQKLEIEKSYRQSQIGIEQQKVKEEATMNALKLKEYSDKTAAQLRIQERIKSGEDYNKVMMEEGPSLFTGAGMASVMRAGQATAPPTDVQAANVLAPGGAVLPGAFAVRGAGGQMEVRNTQGFKSEGAVPQSNAFYARKYAKELEALETLPSNRNFTDEPPEDPVALARWTAFKKKKDFLEGKLSELIPEPKSRAPLPSTSTATNAPSSGGWTNIGGFKVRVKK